MRRAKARRPCEGALPPRAPPRYLGNKEDQDIGQETSIAIVIEVQDGAAIGLADYEGEWRDNKRNGQGTDTYPSGRVRRGLWQNDVLVDP